MNDVILTSSIAAGSSLLVGFATWWTTMRQVRSTDRKSIADVVDERIKIFMDNSEKRIDYLTKELIRANQTIDELQKKVTELERKNLDREQLASENTALKAENTLLKAQLDFASRRTCEKSDCVNRQSA